MVLKGILDFFKTTLKYLEHGADILSMRKIESSVDLIENINRSRFQK